MESSERNRDWEREKDWYIKRSFCCTLQFSSVQSLSCVRLFATPWIATRQASLSITNSWSKALFLVHVIFWLCLWYTYILLLGIGLKKHPWNNCRTKLWFLICLLVCIIFLLHIFCRLKQAKWPRLMTKGERNITSYRETEQVTWPSKGHRVLFQRGPHIIVNSTKISTDIEINHWRWIHT